MKRSFIISLIVNVILGILLAVAVTQCNKTIEGEISGNDIPIPEKVILYETDTTFITTTDTIYKEKLILDTITIPVTKVEEVFVMDTTYITEVDTVFELVAVEANYYRDTLSDQNIDVWVGAYVDGRMLRPFEIGYNVREEPEEIRDKFWLFDGQSEIELIAGGRLPTNSFVYGLGLGRKRWGVKYLRTAATDPQSLILLTHKIKF